MTLVTDRHDAIRVTPSASRLVNSLRDIGYDFPAAIADLVDNSVSAGANHVDIDIKFEGRKSWVRIADDGEGMPPSVLSEAMRYGTQRTYNGSDLGKFGLGLKTASLSQCRALSVASRRGNQRMRIATRRLDIDHIERTDAWEVLAIRNGSTDVRLKGLLERGPGTVVLWEKLDRVLTYADPEGHWARRRMASLARETGEYLGMVFHRFLEGFDGTGKALVIRINGTRIKPWNPFGPSEPRRRVLPPKTLYLDGESGQGSVRFSPVVLPPRDWFSSADAFERLGGPRKWNRQQGFYIYRSGRLIQGGGWSSLRAIDEHTKLARAAIDFDPELDEFFQINVSKMAVGLPVELRTQLEQPVSELCRDAQLLYRANLRVGEAKDVGGPRTAERKGGRGLPGAALAGLAIRAAAMELGETGPLDRIVELVRQRSPESAAALGW